jgi:hypothetical protein
MSSPGETISLTNLIITVAVFWLKKQSIIPQEQTAFINVNYFACYSLELLRSIAINVHPLMEREPSACWVIYLLSSCTECDDILLSNFVVRRAVHLLGECKIGLDNDMKVSRITALVRMLGNLSVRSDVAELLLTESSVVSVLQILLASPFLHIQHETLWFVGNLLNHPSVEIEHLTKTSNFEDSLEPLLSNVITKLL